MSSLAGCLFRFLEDNLEDLILCLEIGLLGRDLKAVAIASFGRILGRIDRGRVNKQKMKKIKGLLFSFIELLNRNSF